MQSKVAVVIPTHKEELNDLEKISLAQARKVLGKYPLIFAVPEGKNFSFTESGDTLVRFPQQFFQNVPAYNRLMMSPLFYERFLDFDYILTYELDAFVFYDALEFFCGLGYDYIGAPWPLISQRTFNGVNSRVGNSGFCLRKVKSHYDFLNEQKNFIAELKGLLPNDDFFAYCGANKNINFHTAPVDIAAKFSVEYLLPHSLKNLQNKLPFGCHGWTKMSADFYVKLFSQFGYDLRPLRDKMNNQDYDMLQNGLLTLAKKRLVRRVNHRRPLMRYLPRNHFASVRVIRSQLAMIIFAQLFIENPALADEVHLYDESDHDILIDDLSLKKEPHLLIAFGNVDNFLISAAERKGISYGRRIVSFEKEYLNHCEKIFRALGK